MARNRWTSIPAVRFGFTHVALGADFQDKWREWQRGIWGGGKKREKRKPLPGICAFTLKIKPSKNPVGEKKAQAGSCIGALLTRIVNVPGIKKQSCVQYDTSLHAFMSVSERLVLLKLWIGLSTRGTIKVVRASSLTELSEQRLAGYLQRFSRSRFQNRWSQNSTQQPSKLD